MNNERIKELVSIEDVAERYGLETNRKGYISCPLHGEDTPSLKLYPSTNTFYCFGCGVGGDVISLVQKLFGLDYRQAVVRLASDFGLITGGGRLDARQALKNRQERAERAKEVKLYREEYTRILAVFFVLWNARRILAPKNESETPHPLFLEALRELPWLDYWFMEHPWK